LNSIENINENNLDPQKIHKAETANIGKVPEVPVKLC